MTLYRLIYYSRNLLGSGESGPAIRQILDASRRNNAQAKVTGALLFNSGCFGQVLEGPQATVEATFERIQCDARHGDVSLLTFEQVPERAFPDWSMGFVGADLDAAGSYADVATASGFDPSRMTGDYLLETLQRLAIEDERRAA